MDIPTVIILMWLCFIQTDLTSGTFCGPEPDICSDCGTNAYCQTYDKDKVIPQTLPTALSEMDILYIGNESARLNSDMFDRYQNLSTIKLYGAGIIGLEENTFANLKHLKYLSIRDTSIPHFPPNILSLNSKISTVDFQNNLLTSIPYYLFDEMPELIELNLGLNSIVLHNCSTIGLQFYNLTELKILKFSNFTFSSDCVNSTTEDFFAPIQQTVEQLLIDGTNIYAGSQKLFKDFQHLRVLDISFAQNFLDCPSKAKELFSYMPESLETLMFRRWRTTSAMRHECVITNDTMSSLKRLPKLVKLDMEYGDSMFGEKLDKSVFSGFEYLSELNIGYTRFSVMEDFVFDGCPNLTYVVLNGNPLSSRPIRLFRNRSESALKHLSLKQTSIYSDYSQTYQAGQLSIDAPIDWLDLHNNYITKMPLFVNNEYGSNDFNTLKKINLDFNFLVDLQNGGNLSSQCEFLPYLTELTVSNNKLKRVKGVCSNLTRLNLAFNELYLYWTVENQNVVSNLEHLVWLDLSYNQIKSLSPQFCANMYNLSQLRLTGNNLTFIDSATFESNYLLLFLHLRANQLIEFSNQIVGSLTTLSRLSLEDNEITKIDPELISYLNNSKSNVRFFGIIGNPLTCSCDQLFFQKWIKTTNIVPFANNLKCSGPTQKLKYQKIYEYKRNNYYCDYRELVNIILTLLGGILGAVLISIPCYKYRWYLSHIRIVGKAILNQLSEVKLEHKCQYDAYVMYNSASDDDIDWVAKDLRLAIETDTCPEERPFKLYIHDRDAPIGSTVHTEMISAMENSRKIIIVLSNSFLKRAQCQGQADLAGRESYGRKVYQPNRIIVLVRERLDEEAIKSPFTSILTENVVDVYSHNESRMNRSWQRIRKFISKPKYEYVHRQNVAAAERDPQIIQADDEDVQRNGDDVRMIS